MIAAALALSIGSLNIDQKVGQILGTHIFTDAGDEEAERLIRGVGIGTVIYYPFANDLSSHEKVATLSKKFQDLATIPLLITIDQEGGRVRRLKEGFVDIPSSKEIAETLSEEEAKELNRRAAEEMKRVGINTNFAPVVDVNSNPDNPVINDRSFGDTPEKVIRFARAALKGYHEGGLLTTLKHFPGHGDTSKDSHLDLPILFKSKDELDAVELKPFKELAGETDLIMTAHISIPELDQDNCATLSKPILNILREEMGFQGVIIADSLLMDGVLKQCASVEEAALRAFQAGCDVLLLGGKRLNAGQADEWRAGDVERVHRHLVTAVRSGEISEERLNASVERILRLKGML